MIYSGKNLKEIVFPLGGIGTGSIGLAGNGSFFDWEIFNRPNKGSKNGCTHFAIKAQYPNGESVTKVLQGDWIKDLIGTYSKGKFSGFGFGAAGTMCGFPHFKNVIFEVNFPIATLTFEDDDFPAKVILKAFNPFIPLDAYNSSLPAAFFEINVESFVDDVKYLVLFSVCNPFDSSKNEKIVNSKYTAVKLICSDKTEEDKDYGDLTVAVSSKEGFCQEYWYRGEWLDSLTTFWCELSEGNLNPRHYEEPASKDMCSVGLEKIINANSSEIFNFVLSWNVPNHYKYWKLSEEEEKTNLMWKNYYATVFKDSVESCFYCLDNWKILYEKTSLFSESLHNSTLDEAVIDAVSSTISVLKTPTVLRLTDGSFYGWEGLHELEGSCEGTCTHVWSYAYALCYLFPELERSLRDIEFKYDTDEDGRMYFRTALPLGSGHVVQPPCVDGQMATVIKIYRDWKITGNNKWLEDNWNNVKKILEYAWNENNEFEWDRDKDGVLEGRQHHTLDMELFGPSSWLESMYLAALKAASIMADFLGDTEKKIEYSELFEKGYNWTKENLFNGEYFYHKIDLTNKEYTEHFDCNNYWNEEKQQLKYQVGEGSIIDQMLGQWHANICGLGDIFDKEQRQIALKNMLKNNYKVSLSKFANPWRVFALNDESGTVMCDYPKGKNKPIIPIPYCEECMTGFEYSFAGLLISEGLIEEGLEVVRAIRNRYDGEKRNPLNEIECGSNYARPMASFALLTIFSGLDVDLPNKYIGFSPIISGDFKCMWSLGSGWGVFVKENNFSKIIVHDGKLELNMLSLGYIGKVDKVLIDGKNIEFEQKNDKLFFDNIIATKEIYINEKCD